MREFDHIGIPTSERHPGEKYVEETKVWITDPAAHPQKIEYLRFEPDTPVTGPVREMPHIAFRVDDLDRAMEGEEVLLGPFRPTRTLRVVFTYKEGAVYEYMESTAGAEWFEQDR